MGDGPAESSFSRVGAARSLRAALKGMTSTIELEYEYRVIE
jgi:hypothetical protein